MCNYHGECGSTFKCSIAQVAPPKLVKITIDNNFKKLRRALIMVHTVIRGVARIWGKGVLSMRARSTCANFGHAHLQNGKVEVQIITENAF